MGDQLMKAMRFHDFGGPEVMRIEVLPIPVPATGEVRVKVEAAGVNPVDWKIRSGYAGALVLNALPTAPGTEIAGIVDAIGDGVEGWSVGDEVMSHQALWGGYAEYVNVRAALLARKPGNVSFEQAGGASLSLLTAWGAIHTAAALRAGQRILILGGAGGVGGAAIQFAKIAGAEVLATSSLAKQPKVKAFGADLAIAYDAPEAVNIPEVDVILDCVGTDQGKKMLPFLKTGGLYVTVVHPLEAEVIAGTGRRAVFFGVEPDGAKLSHIAALIGQGAVTLQEPVLFALADAGDAQVMSETGHAPSRIVLTLPHHG